MEHDPLVRNRSHWRHARHVDLWITVLLILTTAAALVFAVFGLGYVLQQLSRHLG